MSTTAAMVLTARHAITNGIATCAAIALIVQIIGTIVAPAMTNAWVM